MPKQLGRFELTLMIQERIRVDAHSPSDVRAAQFIAYTQVTMHRFTRTIVVADGLTVNVYSYKQDACLGIVTGCSWREVQSGNDETFQTILRREVTITGPRPVGFKIDWIDDNRVWLYFKHEGRAWRAEAHTGGNDLVLVFEVQDVPEAHED